jgi:hypothetical protein
MAWQTSRVDHSCSDKIPHGELAAQGVLAPDSTMGLFSTAPNNPPWPMSLYIEPLQPLDRGLISLQLTQVTGDDIHPAS